MADAILTKTFGETVAVRDLDLAVPEGALYGVIGPKGAGKTTTTLEVLGRNSALEAKDRIGYLPEERGLYNSARTGTKRSSEVGSCPHWSGGVEQQLTKEIEQFGRVRIYGINFDTDSDRIRDESRVTLDRVAAVLKARPQWNISIEGHTDSTGSASHNQELSLRRANAVKQYLAGAGIQSARLTTAGQGSSMPVAPNDTVLGRAENRRVELVKQ